MAKPVVGENVPFAREQDAKYLQKAAVSMAASWFMERGYMVSLPIEPALYDMVVESDDGLVRVQVKSTVRQDKAGRWAVRICRLAYDRHANSGRTRRSYSADEIDYFFVVTGCGDKYLIPLGIVQGIGALTLDSKYSSFKLPDGSSREGEPDRRAGPRC